MKLTAAGVMSSLPVLAHAAVTPVVTPAPAISAAGSLLQVFIGLIAVLLLIAATAWVAKRFGVTRSRASNVLHVISSASVGTRERVVVVEVGESWLVIGVAPGSVNALMTLPRGETPSPAATGEEGAYKLLILSQVILSLQLPFAVVPLIHFTNDKVKMGSFANSLWVRVLAWASAALIVGLNLWLAISVIGTWPAWVVVPLAVALLGLLAYVALHPWLHLRPPEAAHLPPVPPPAEVPVYRNILVPLDHTSLDRVALAHAAALARVNDALLHLLHIEEGVASQLYGELALTAEVAEGRRYFEDLLAWIRSQGLRADLEIVPRGDPKEVIVKAAARFEADLLVMGAHGHKGIKDIVFGATINEVRHRVGVPVLIVRHQSGA